MAVALTIQALKDRLGGAKLDDAQPDRVLKTGWSVVDVALGGGLPAGALHEWFGDAVVACRRGEWSPPICVLAHLAWQAFDADSPPRWVVWVGSDCFPYPSVLARSAGSDLRLLDQSLFVAAHTTANRLWAIDLALRSPAVGVVVADGSALSMPATRRMQLLAKKHQTLACVARPPWERGELSCAQTRWCVRWQPHPPMAAHALRNPRWSVELIRCKGVQIENNHGPWVVEWDSDTRTLNLSSEMAHSAGAAKTQSGNSRIGYAARSA